MYSCAGGALEDGLLIDPRSWRISDAGVVLSPRGDY